MKAAHANSPTSLGTPRVALLVGAVIVLILVLAAASIWTHRARNAPAPGGVSQFISFDDGANWESDFSGEIAPIARAGKTASEAILYSCDGGKTRWVGYLVRYSPRGKQLLAESRRQLEAGRTPEPLTELQRETEIKRPGDSEWVRMSDLRASAAVFAGAAKCPHGGAHQGDAISP